MCKLSGIVKEIFYLKLSQTVVFVTTSLMIYTYSILDMENESAAFKQKISVGSSKENVNIRLMEPCMISICSKENFCRVHNFLNNKLFNISSSNSSNRMVDSFYCEQQNIFGILFENNSLHLLRNLSTIHCKSQQDFIFLRAIDLEFSVK